MSETPSTPVLPYSSAQESRAIEQVVRVVLILGLIASIAEIVTFAVYIDMMYTVGYARMTSWIEISIGIRIAYGIANLILALSIADAFRGANAYEWVRWTAYIVTSLSVYFLGELTLSYLTARTYRVSSFATGMAGRTRDLLPSATVATVLSLGVVRRGRNGR